MQLLDLTLDTPAENLALDEALLTAADAGELRTEVLRLWEPREFMVVLGSSSRATVEARLAVCRQRRIAVVRRSSGGAAIVTGPGCLMYGLLLDRRRPELRGIDSTHRFVLDTMAAAIGRLRPGIGCRGTSDLAIGERKFSGNSLRVKSNWLLYHGTLLYRFPIGLMETCLATPPRQPAYRAGRQHTLFVANLPLEAAALREAMAGAFNAVEPLAEWPRELTARLTAEKFTDPDWTYRML